MKIFPLFISNSGCPGRCVFCAQALNTGVAAPPQPEEVALLLAEQLPVGGVDQVAFYGGTFTALPEALQQRYLDAVRPLLDAGRVGGIRLSTRSDAVTPATAGRLRAAGVDTVELGCQSFDDAVLLASGRNCSATTVAPAVDALRRAGLQVGIQLMPGLPGATPDEACASLRRALALKPDFLRIYPALVLDGTALAASWRDGGYRPLDLEDAVRVCADMALLCHAAGVPVLRFGLQSVPELDAGGVLAGPYHPAFGQLVRSRLWLRAARRLAPDVSPALLQVHPHDLSDLLGQARGNLARLRRDRPGLQVGVCRDLPRGALRLGDTTYDMMALAAG